MDISAIAAEKARIRADGLARRDALSEADRDSGSKAVAERLAALIIPPASTLSAFLPIRSELDLRPAIAIFLARGHIIGLPIMRKPDLIFRAYDPDQPMVPLGFGTYGPGPEAAVVEPDVMLVPLSAFDRAGGRTGYGKAFYDLTIARLRAEKRDPLLIGVAFSVQETAHVPMEPHDVALDAIVTERETIRTPAGNLKEL